MAWYYDGYGMMGGIGFFGMFLMLLFWIGVIWFIVWLVRQSKNFGSSDDETPSRILKKRYAKGEITKKEYEDMRKEIEK